MKPSRTIVCALAMTWATVLGFASPARGQIGAPLLTAGLDLRKAPVGSYSEYLQSVGSWPPYKMHQALVRKDARSYTLETVLEHPEGREAYQVTLRAPVLPLTLLRVIGQHADFSPMEHGDLTRAPAHAEKPDPKTLVGDEVIDVPAGRFKTKHYRQTSSIGTTDLWISDQVGVFRVVRMARRGLKPYKIELVRHGTDAKPVITKPAEPHDQKKWTAQYESLHAAPPGK
jgi:hypothetical protein